MAKRGCSEAASSSEAAATLPSSSELLDLSREICSVWTNIGIKLGLKKSTLDDIAGTPSLDTPQKKAFEMLIKWRQLQTSPSHVAQLVSALELEGRGDLARKYCKWQGRGDHHKRKKPHIEQGQHAALPSQIQGANDEVAEQVKVILRDVRERYKRREAFLQPFPWCESHERSLQNIYTEVKMVSRKRDRSELTDQACKMCDIFQSHEECRDNPRVVLLEGDPGMGKTVFCQKLTYDWAMGKTDGFMAEVEVLLKLQCRDLENSDIKDAIIGEFLPDDSPDEVKEAIINYIRVGRTKTLIVLDGMDELREGIDLSRLINGKIFPGCRVLMTSRSNEGLRRHCDTLLQVIGFTREKGRDFIVKYFADDKEKSSALLDRIRLDGMKNSDLLSLIRSPLNTILVCAVFQETGGQLPVHTTHLYKEIVACIVRIRYKKKGEQPPADPVAEHKEELAALGRLALQGIKDDQLHFSEDDFQADDPAKTILQFGFLSKQTSASVLRPRSSYQFLHKTMQEFLAAMCLHEQLTSGNFTCLDYLFKFKQVAVFVAGLLSQDEAGRQLLPRFVSSLTRSMPAGDYALVSSSFLFICAVLRECVGCPHQELERVVAREFGWEGLWLSGLRLDENSAEYRIACGALRKENCPLKLLNLRSNNIHDGSLLAESLRDNTSLLWLSLSGNPLTADSASALARVLSAHPTLEWLHWPKEFRGEMEGRQHRNPRLEIYYN